MTNAVTPPSPSRPAPATKAARQARIVTILSREQVHSQEQLAGLLSEYANMHVTQATLSRDLDELGVVRLRAADGALVYALPGDPGGPGAPAGASFGYHERARVSPSQSHPSPSGRGHPGAPAPKAGPFPAPDAGPLITPDQAPAPRASTAGQAGTGQAGAGQAGTDPRPDGRSASPQAGSRPRKSAQPGSAPSGSAQPGSEPGMSDQGAAGLGVSGQGGPEHSGSGYSGSGHPGSGYSGSGEGAAGYGGSPHGAPGQADADPDAVPQPHARPSAVSSRLTRYLKELLTSAEASANLVVLRTPAGAAQFLASAIDHADWPAILGTVAGDDTVLVITRDPTGGETLADDFRHLAERRR